jgi:hypothetical protein
MGVGTCLLTAMSLLAFLGLRHRVRMLPIPLFEVAWTVHWIAVIAIPGLVADDMNAANPGGPVQRGARHLEFAVRNPRAVRRQAGRARVRRALPTARLSHDATPKDDRLADTWPGEMRKGNRHSPV